MDRFNDILVAIERLESRVEAVERVVENLREMTGHLFDVRTDWAARVERMRREPGYQAAFDGQPLVSVRIATYKNTDKLIHRSLPSVFRQTYPNWEVVIVGDGSPTDCEARIRCFDDQRIRFVNRPYNGPYPDGSAAHWMVQATYPYNEGAALANGAWIAPLDDDDEWTEDHIELLLKVAQRHRAELVYGRMRAVIDGTDVETWFGAFPPCQGDFGFQAALYHSALREFRYDSFAYLRDEVSDWNLARRMWEAGVRFHFVDDVVGIFHVDPAANSASWWRERARERGPLIPAQSGFRTLPVRMASGPH
jgi:glycosyltransferase involved in cell wall biosynthesis